MQPQRPYAKPSVLDCNLYTIVGARKIHAQFHQLAIGLMQIILTEDYIKIFHRILPLVYDTEI